jgi:hypothetical protein
MRRKRWAGWNGSRAVIPVDLDTRAETFISLQRPRVGLEVDGQLKDYVFRSSFWSLTVFEGLDSNPGGNRDHSDFGTEIMVGWEC